MIYWRCDKSLGICFGHQIIARALGGTCIRNTTWETGSTRIALTNVGQKLFRTNRDSPFVVRSRLSLNSSWDHLSDYSLAFLVRARNAHWPRHRSSRDLLTTWIERPDTLSRVRCALQQYKKDSLSISINISDSLPESVSCRLSPYIATGIRYSDLNVARSSRIHFFYRPLHYRDVGSWERFIEDSCWSGEEECCM